jgi:hypothetical protein
MYNPETLATLGTQNTGQRVEKTKGTIKIENPEILTTLGTESTGQREKKTKKTSKNGQHRSTDNNVWFSLPFVL